MIAPIVPLWLLIVITTVLSGVLIIQCLIDKKESSINKLKYLAPKIAIVILLFIVGLRPMIPEKDESHIQVNDLDILFVVDNTISMVAEDYGDWEPRIDAAKVDMQHIMETLSGAQFSLITFANSATIVAPYTYDQNMVKAAIEALEPLPTLYARGSSLNAPIDSIKTIATSAEKKEEKRTRIIIFISDGEITDDSTLDSYADISKHFAYGAVIGYGTETGGRMKSHNSYDYGSYIKYYSDGRNSDSIDSDYNAISKINETNLKKIANDLNGDYIHARTHSDIKPILEKISKLANQDTAPDDEPTGMDLYYIFTIPLLPLLFFEFNKLWRKKV